MIRHALLLALSALALAACSADVRVDPGPWPDDGPGPTLSWMLDDADVTRLDGGISESTFAVDALRYDSQGCYLDSYDGFTKREIAADLDLAGFRAGTIEQVLAYGHDHPGETVGERVVALGSSQYSFDDAWPLYWRTSSSSAQLDLTNGDVPGEEQWDDGTLFIACP